LTANDGNPNNAQVRFLIDGAPMPSEVADYERIVLVFDGEDEDAVAKARAQWTDAKAHGLAATYWQPDESGRWQQKA
jgi:DNA polymerase-3 subunit chi